MVNGKVTRIIIANILFVLLLLTPLFEDIYYTGYEYILAILSL